jgi:TolC family type I secretion outer membrane protein
MIKYAATTRIAAIFALALVVGLLFPQTGKAQSFNVALKLALENNPVLAAARSEYKAVRQNQYVALGNSLPQIAAYARSTTNDMTTLQDYTGEEVSLLSKHRNDSWGLTGEMVVFSSGKNLNDFRKARADIAAQRVSLINTEQTVLLEAVQAILDVLKDQAVMSLRRKNVQVLERQFQATNDQFEVGIVTRTDVAQSESRLKLAQSNLLLQNASFAASRAFYREVIGQDSGQLSPPEALPELPESLEAALQFARSNSPVLRTAQEYARGARYTTYSTVGGALPKVSLFGNYAVTEDPNRMKIGLEEEVTNFGIEVSMPVFTGGKTLAAINASRHVANNTRLQVHAASNKVERQVTVTWNNFNAASGRIEASSQQIAASEIALEGVKQELELGTRTILDVLDAEQELLDARVAQIQAERDQILSAYSLLSAIGKLTGTNLGIVASAK